LCRPISSHASLTPSHSAVWSSKAPARLHPRRRRQSPPRACPDGDFSSCKILIVAGTLRPRMEGRSFSFAWYSFTVEGRDLSPVIRLARKLNPAAARPLGGAGPSLRRRPSRQGFPCSRPVAVRKALSLRRDHLLKYSTGSGQLKHAALPSYFQRSLTTPSGCLIPHRSLILSATRWAGSRSLSAVIWT